MYKLAGCTFQLIKLGFSSMRGQNGSLGLYSNCRIRNSGSIVAARFSPATNSDRIDELTSVLSKRGVPVPTAADGPCDTREVRVYSHPELWYQDR